MHQFSIQAQRLAADYHLGTPLAVYRASVTTSNLLYLLIGGILVAGLVVQGIHGRSWLVLLPILLIAVLLWGLLESTWWTRDLCMVVCTDGLLRLWHDETESVRWDEISELWRDRRGHYAFSRADGTRFIVNHIFHHADELSSRIEEKVTERLLPRVLALYQRGEPVRFGQVQVSRQGIKVGGMSLPWDKVAEVQVQGGMLAFKQQGMALHELYAPVNRIPNLCVLEALIETILQAEA
jgi:hypothetical protein